MAASAPRSSERSGRSEGRCCTPLACFDTGPVSQPELEGMPAALLVMIEVLGGSGNVGGKGSDLPTEVTGRGKVGPPPDGSGGGPPSDTDAAPGMLASGGNRSARGGIAGAVPPTVVVASAAVPRAGSGLPAVGAEAASLAAGPSVLSCGFWSAGFSSAGFESVGFASALGPGTLRPLRALAVRPSAAAEAPERVGPAPVELGLAFDWSCAI